MKSRTILKIRDAVEILHHRFIAGKPRMEAMAEEERIHAEIARQIYRLRTEAGLSQRQLARRVGTTASVICRLEDVDYEGYSLSMLRRIAEALGCRVRISITKKAGTHPSVRSNTRSRAHACR